MQSTIDAMDDEQWDKLIQDVAYLFDDLTLKRGFQYYKQKRVRPFAVTDDHKIITLVEGNDDYSVTIDLDNLGHSRCECPVKGPCKHMAAVLMHYADMQNRSVQMLANAKAAASLHPPASPKLPPGAASMLARQDLLKEQADRMPDAGVAEWREYCVSCIAPLAHTSRTPGYAEKAIAAILKYKPSMSPATEKLFLLHAHLFVLETITKPQGAAQGAFASSMGYFAHLTVTELQDSIGQLLTSGLPLKVESQQWPRATEILAYLRMQMLSEPRGRSREQPYFRIAYELYWKYWLEPNLSDNKLYEEEIAQLRAAETELGTSLSRHAWLLAQSRMYFYLGDDPPAWDHLRTAADTPALQPEDLLGFLEPLYNTGDWERLVNWLTQTGPLLGSRIYGNLKDYSTYWDAAVAQRPESEPLMWSTLSEMLPLAGEIYSEKLIIYEKWQAWMDYQLANGKEPADFRVRDLQPLEKHAPETLLPFYHQAVERFVLDKNRQSYKAAVKLLKRLSKLYKKMKQEERWELYMHSFSVRNSRLRALQEELRKGKLIT
ncbi:SWIM zinc finger domain-containing protein [Paenibacillus sp. GCM10012306]|uniref:SWIM zinc finger family protein n=1 Tax=Paenibacillus sp. GCM10012306 TaxID=3317342 RepID=UPI00360B68DB